MHTTRTISLTLWFLAWIIKTQPVLFKWSIDKAIFPVWSIKCHEHHKFIIAEASRDFSGRKCNLYMNSPSPLLWRKKFIYRLQRFFFLQSQNATVKNFIGKHTCPLIFSLPEQAIFFWMNAIFYCFFIVISSWHLSVWEKKNWKWRSLANDIFCVASDHAFIHLPSMFSLISNLFNLCTLVECQHYAHTLTHVSHYYYYVFLNMVSSLYCILNEKIKWNVINLTQQASKAAE